MKPGRTERFKSLDDRKKKLRYIYQVVARADTIRSTLEMIPNPDNEACDQGMSLVEHIRTLVKLGIIESKTAEELDELFSCRGKLVNLKPGQSVHYDPSLLKVADSIES